MRFNVLTLFPEIITRYLQTSIIGNAHEQGVLDTAVYQIRDFAQDKHKTVDDTPYGGGAGMVMKVEPIDKALQAVRKDSKKDKNNKIVVLSARGSQFTQKKAKEYASLDSLTLICGRYEGIDQRVADYLADEELSIGPYVLAGGELAALTVIEATSRLIPGVLGNTDSLRDESHNVSGIVEAPQYTKPEQYRDWQVPEILLSGNHEKIRNWKRNIGKL